MVGHVYGDESKRRDFVMVAAAVLPGDLDAARKTVQGLYLPRQHGLHMVKEGEGRQRTILRTITAMNVAVTVYVAPREDHSTEREARLCSIERLVEDIALEGHENLCLERDESIAAVDRRTISLKLKQVGYRNLTYSHSKATSEPLLAIPDAVAWAWPQKGQWRRACDGIVRQVKVV